MNTKLNYLIVVASLFFIGSCLSTTAQTKKQGKQDKTKYDTVFEITDKSCSIKNDKIHLNIDLLVSGHQLTKNETVIFTPIYTSKNDKIYFKTIVVSGQRVGDCKFKKRRIVEQYIKDNPKILTTYNKKDLKEYKNGKMLEYEITEPFPSSLPLDGKIKIEKRYSRCYDVKEFEPEYIDLYQEMNIIPNAELANITFYVPENEIVKKRQTSTTLYIQYKLDKANIEPNLANNRAELEKIHNLLAQVTDNRNNYSANKINIYGYASPEGTYKHNLDLSKKRSNEVAKYIHNKYSTENINITSNGYGEDWEGLISLVEHNNNVTFKDDIIRIIKYVDIFQGREKQLMELDHGKPYKYILKNIFPALRRTKVELDYTVRPFSEEEIVEIYETHPQDLSQLELYKLASKNNQTIENRETFGEEYIKAAELFSDDPIANINASSAALIRNDLEQAKAYLDKVTNNPMAYNNIGLLYMLLGNKDKAREYFDKASRIDLNDENQAEAQLKARKTALRNIAFCK